MQMQGTVADIGTPGVGAGILYTLVALPLISAAKNDRMYAVLCYAMQL